MYSILNIEMSLLNVANYILFDTFPDCVYFL